MDWLAIIEFVAALVCVILAFTPGTRQAPYTRGGLLVLALGAILAGIFRLVPSLAQTVAPAIVGIGTAVVAIALFVVAMRRGETRA